jgi:hypothetical protein
MNTITQKELLEFCLSNAREILASQYLEIDDQYNLLDRYRWVTANDTLSHNVKGITEPLITINELEGRNIIVINIKYNRLNSFGHPVGDIELNLLNLKYIIKDGEIYKFDKIVK